MAKKLQLRGGTTSEHSTFTGAAREVTVDTTKDSLVVHDGVTAGGIPLAKSSDITLGTLSVTADATELNKLDGATASTAELNHVTGVTSSIQTQLGTLTTDLGNVNTDLVNDTTPQLGGDLDLNGHAITGLASNALKTDFTVAAGKTVTAGTVVNFANGEIGDNPTVNAQSALQTSPTYSYEYMNDSGTLVVRSETSGADHQVRVGVVSATGVVAWNAITTIWNGYSGSGTTLRHLGGDNFSLNGNTATGWNTGNTTVYGYVVFFSLNPTTGATAGISSAWTMSYSGGNYQNTLSPSVYKMSDGKVGVYWSRSYYHTQTGGWHYNHIAYVATFTNSGGISTNSTDTAITSSSYWEKVASGSQYLGQRGSSTWKQAAFNGTTLSSYTDIDWDSSYFSNFNSYIPDATLDIFVCAFINTSNQFVINTYSYASPTLTRTNSYVVIDSGAGVSIGSVAGSGNNIVIGYEDNSKGYVATFTLDGTTKAVSGSGIAVLHNTSNKAVDVSGPNNTNKYTCSYNSSGSQVTSSVMTVNAYATSSLNWVGVAAANGAAGNPTSVIVDGVAGGFTGLSVGMTYYYNTTSYDGTLTTTINDYKIGRAVSTTEVLLNA